MNDTVHKRDLIEGFITGLNVIQAFGDETPTLTVSQLALRVEISRAAARRYMVTLVHSGMAMTDGRQYWLSPKVLSLGHSFLDSARLPRTVAPFVQKLAQQVQETCTFSVLDGADVVYLCRASTPKLMSFSYEPGARLPVHASAAGMVMLASLSPFELDDWLQTHELTPFTAHTLITPAAIRIVITKIQTQGYALSENQYELGMRGISVAVRNRKNQLIGALSVSTITAAATYEEIIRNVIPAMQDAARGIMAVV